MQRPILSYFLTGISFAILWSSASIAGKFGLKSVEPLVFFTSRFLLAGALLLTYAHGIEKTRWPAGREWWNLTVFGAFNTALYLGLFIIALQYVAAGITALAIALNPLLISIMTSLWTKRPVKIYEWISIVLGIIGVATATYPLLQTGYATTGGLLLLALAMVTYSMGSVFYSSVTWNLSRTAINGWQVLFGGLMLVPFTVYFFRGGNDYDERFWLSLLWLVVPVSIFAVQLWLRLLKEDAVKASLWLFLCPIFGLALASLLLNEPYSVFTSAGAAIVLLALYIGQKTSS